MNDVQDSHSSQYIDKLHWSSVDWLQEIFKNAMPVPI